MIEYILETLSRFTDNIDSGPNGDINETGSFCRKLLKFDPLGGTTPEFQDPIYSWLVCINGFANVSHHGFIPTEEQYSKLEEYQSRLKDFLIL